MSFHSDMDDFFSSTRETIISDQLRFKNKLGIGEKAYKSLRMRENLTTISEAVGVAGAASAAAGSSVVATTFFAGSSALSAAFSAVGIGAFAATPVGWVVSAGVLSGAAYMGISRLLESPKDTGLTVIPKYINAPIDLIALAMIEMMLPVSLKIARSDGVIDTREIQEIGRFYSSEWGYSPSFVSKLIEVYQPQLDSLSYIKLAGSLSKYCAESKDCNPVTIRDEFIIHLREVIEADGVIDPKETEELGFFIDAFANIENDVSVLRSSLEAGKDNIIRGANKSKEAVSSTAKNTASAIASGFSTSTNTLKNMGGSVSSGTQRLSSLALAKLRKSKINDEA